MDNKTVANTIWKQMNTIDKNLVWCMGTRKPTIIEQGLQFRVSGLAFKGLVQVILEPNDTYRVKFLRGKTVVGEYKEVYVETLMPLLEEIVEKGKKD